MATEDDFIQLQIKLQSLSANDRYELERTHNILQKLHENVTIDEYTTLCLISARCNE